MAENQEVVGFHKGAVSTLLKERQELAKMVQVVDQLLAAHLKALKDLGIEIESEPKKQAKEKGKAWDDDKLEDLLK